LKIPAHYRFNAAIQLHIQMRAHYNKIPILQPGAHFTCVEQLHPEVTVLLPPYFGCVTSRRVKSNPGRERKEKTNKNLTCEHYVA